MALKVLLLVPCGEHNNHSNQQYFQKFVDIGVGSGCVVVGWDCKRASETNVPTFSWYVDLVLCGHVSHMLSMTWFIFVIVYWYLGKIIFLFNLEISN